MVGTAQALFPAQYVVGLQDRLKAQYDQIKLVLDRKVNRNIMANRRAKVQNLQIGDLVLEIAPGTSP